MLPEWSTCNTASRKYDDRFSDATAMPTTFAEAPIGVALPPMSVPRASVHARTDRSAPEVAARLFDDRDHRSRKWNIINDRACYSGDPDNNNYDKCDISTTDRMNKGCDQFENTGFFQTANDYK